MPNAVVFAFAVEDGLSPVIGAAPFDVLARQIPRILVGQLNGGGDRGVRFFPFLGPVDGARSFLRLREPLEPKALVALHKQDDGGERIGSRRTCRALIEAALHSRDEQRRRRLVDGERGQEVGDWLEGGGLHRELKKWVGG